jgi:penicillin-binding protein 1A
LGPAPTKAADIVRRGDIVRISRREKALRATDTPETASVWRLSQIPVAEGALVALDPTSGAIVALAGGYDFARSKFNRITQALRQPGSNFKPFIYSAALANGYTPASEVNDAPIVFEAPGLDEAWRPENYSGTYYGPTPLREALANSRNLVSIRMMREMGVETVLHHVERFGFDPAHLPQNLSLALGSGEVTPLQIARGYAVFANGGFLIEPWFISRIETAEGTVVEKHLPGTACAACEAAVEGVENEPTDLEALRATSGITPVRPAPRVIDARNAWLMYSMMKDVITRGTARSALVLGRTDLAGKTGTTNDLKDAWFSGFNAGLVAPTWIGLDDSQSLGDGETGARTALPMWIDFMRTALAKQPSAELPQPAGLVTVRVADDARGKPRYETFRAEDAPPATAPGTGPNSAAPAPSDRAVEQLF